jgi:hypothetical protein
VSIAASAEIGARLVRADARVSETELSICITPWQARCAHRKRKPPAAQCLVTLVAEMTVEAKLRRSDA